MSVNISMLLTERIPRERFIDALRFIKDSYVPCEEDGIDEFILDDKSYQGILDFDLIIKEASEKDFERCSVIGNFIFGELGKKGPYGKLMSLEYEDGIFILWLDIGTRDTSNWPALSIITLYSKIAEILGVNNFIQCPDVYGEYFEEDYLADIEYIKKQDKLYNILCFATKKGTKKPLDVKEIAKYEINGFEVDSFAEFFVEVRKRWVSENDSEGKDLKFFKENGGKIIHES